MIRVLVTIAVVGFLVSVASLAGAVAIAGPDVLTHGGWAWHPTKRDWWSWTVTNDDNGNSTTASSSDGQTTRELAWTGGDSLDIAVPADVQYVQRNGPAKLTLTGPADAVADVRIEDGRISYGDSDRDDRITIALTAPSVTRFAMRGEGNLVISGYDQDSLGLDLDAAAAAATGRARSVKLNIAGDGHADLGGLKVREASVDVEGSGTAAVAPTDSAEVDISGSGDVTLLTHPPKLQTNISGSGHLHEQGPAQAGSSAS